GQLSGTVPDNCPNDGCRDGASTRRTRTGPGACSPRPSPPGWRGARTSFRRWRGRRSSSRRPSPPAWTWAPGPAPSTLLDLPRLEAGGADPHPLRGTGHHGPDPLDVGVPAPLRPAVGVAHPHAHPGPLPADLTDRRHFETS